MPQRVWFGNEYIDFPDGTPDDDIKAIGRGWQEFGDLSTSLQKIRLEKLSSNPDFLALPRIDRHAQFNTVAKDGPYWQLLEPDQRRLMREEIVNNAPGANEQETRSYQGPGPVADKWDIPDEIERTMPFFLPGGRNGASIKAAQAIAGYLRGLDRSFAPTVTGGAAGSLNLLDTAVRNIFEGVEKISPKRDQYTNPLWAGYTKLPGNEDEPMPEEGMVQPEGMGADAGAIYRRATGPVVDAARRLAVDASIGASVQAEERKYATFQEAAAADDWFAPVEFATELMGEQTPIVGAIAGASAIPGVGAVLGPATAMSLETGNVLVDLEQQGITGEDAQDVASAVGVVSGALEYLPIGRLLKRNPVVAKTWKSYLARKAYQALKQGGEEAFTEFVQTGVQEASGDFVKMYRDELDTIPAWTTKEGRTETLGHAWQASVEGGLIGLIMGPLGGGTGQVRPDVQEALSRAETNEDVEYALGELMGVRGDAGPTVGEFEQMPPTYPDQGPPADAVPGVVAPTGPAPSSGDALPLLLGPEGAASLPRGEWSADEEMSARKMYAPPWLLNAPKVASNFIRGDIGPAEQAEILDLADELGIDRQQAMDDIQRATDSAFAFLRGDVLQGEQPDLAKRPPPPDEFPTAPTQAHGVEGGAMRLGEGIVAEDGAETGPPVAAVPPQTPPGTDFGPEGAPPAAVPESPVTPPVAPPAGAADPRFEAMRRASRRGAELKAQNPDMTEEELARAEERFFYNEYKELTGEEPPYSGQDQRGTERRQADRRGTLIDEEARQAWVEQDRRIVEEDRRQAARRRAEEEAVGAAGVTEEQIAAGTLESNKTRLQDLYKKEARGEKLEAWETRVIGELEQSIPERDLKFSPKEVKARVIAEVENAKGEVAPPVSPEEAKEQATRKAQRRQKLWEIKNKEASPEEKQANYDAILAEELAGEVAPATPYKPPPSKLELRIDRAAKAFRTKLKNKEPDLTEAELDARVEDYRDQKMRDWAPKEAHSQSIQAFVRERGGIKAYTDGSLTEEMRGTHGRGGIKLSLLNNETGMFLDEMLNLAISAGKMPPGSTESDLIEALRGEDISPQEQAERQMEAEAREGGPTDEQWEEMIQKGEEPPFSVGKPERVKPAQAADIRRGLPGWSMERVGPAMFRMSRKGQPLLHVSLRREPASQEELDKAAKYHGLSTEELVAGIRSGELAVKGAYTFDEATGVHLLTLYSPNAGPETVFHEAFHFAFHNVLTPQQRKRLLQIYKTEEEAAKAYQKFAAKEGAKSTAQRIFEVIRNFARRMLGSNDVDLDAAQALMKKISSGKIFDQEGGTFTRTNLAGDRALAKFANTILSAEQAAEAAQKERKLKEDEFGAALESAFEEAGHSFVARGDENMFSLETTTVPPGHHPGATIPNDTLTENLRDRAEKVIFNKLTPLRVMQEKLTRLGEEINEGFNAYLHAQNFQARAGALLDWVEQNLFKPFLDELADSGINMGDFDRFRMAAHALERNPKVFEAHVNAPLAVAEKKIKALSKKPLTDGTKVRAADRGSVGTVAAVFPDRGKAEVTFVDPKNPMAKKTVLMEMKDLERESVARAKDDIAEIRRMVEAGEVPHSGITTEDATAILEELRMLGLVTWTGELGPDTNYRGQLGSLSRKFTDIVRWKEETLVKAGLLSKEELKKWRDYKHYAPMRGKDPDIMDIISGGRRLAIPEIEMYGGKLWHRALARTARSLGVEGKIHLPNAGKGYNPGRRPASHRALGRRSFPKHSPTVELFTDTMEAAVRAERNRVAKTVWNLLNQFRDAVDQNGVKLFEIDRPESRIYFDEKTSTVKTKVDGLSVVKDNVYPVWIDGELHYIRHVSPEMAEFVSALNNLGNNASHPLLKGGAAANRWISKMATSRNPAFTIPNAFRDAITAGIKLAGEKQFKDFGLKTMKRAPEAWLTLAEYARRQSKGTLDQMDPVKRKRVDDFKLAGGETAFWMIPDLENQMRKLQKNLQEARGEGNAGIQGIKAIINFIEDYNGAVENTLRFAVFEEGIDMGVSKDKSARLARNITVDFTQQGTVGRHLGGLYVFANASLQGSQMVYKAARHNKEVQRMLLAGAAMAMAWGPMMRAFGGEDDDDGVAYWDKITPYEKSRNLIVMVPGGKGKRVKIPLPWGFNVVWNAGISASDAMFGPRTAEEAFFNIMSSAMSSFNPIGDNDLGSLAGWFQMAMPAWADPISDIALNKSFWGGPIRPEPGKFARSEQYGKEATNYNRYFTGVSEPSKAMAKALYKYAGIDISPEDVDYGVGAVFGGLGDLVFKTIGLGINATTRRRALVARDFPIVKSFFADEGTYFAPDMYRTNMSDFWSKKETYDDLKKNDPRSAAEFKKRHYDVLRMEDYVKATEKRIRELKKRGVETRDSRMQSEYKRFNRRFNTAEKITMKRRIKER